MTTQEHHLVPKILASDKLIEKFGELFGFDTFNDERNLLDLPSDRALSGNTGLGYHTGRHVDSYTRRIEVQLLRGLEQDALDAISRGVDERTAYQKAYEEFDHVMVWLRNYGDSYRIAAQLNASPSANGIGSPLSRG